MASGSQIGPGQIISLEEEGQARGAGRGVGNTVPEVQCGRCTTLAEAEKGIRREFPMRRGEGQNFGSNFRNKGLDNWQRGMPDFESYQPSR